MDPEVARSRLAVSRRRALGVGGSIGLGTLLAACAPAALTGGSPSGAATAGPTPTASDGSTIAPTTASTADLVAKLEATAICGMETEEVTQGPYWFDVDSIRSDVREDRPGLPLRLAFRVLDEGCLPVANAVVEIWHCDAGGAYSGFEVSSQGGMPGGAPAGGQGGAPGGGSGGGSGETSSGSYSAGVQEASPSDDGTYLRGAQVTDANGIAQFTTVYPGWYRGRTVHVHLKVHIDKANVLTAQVGFDDALSDEIFATVDPYTAHAGRDTYNGGTAGTGTDDILDSAAQLLTMEKAGDGYLGYINLGL
jgi:protocatechuate 3,4-dioxygenase beta subunit